MDNVANLWDKLDAETELAYSAFWSYLELGPTRSLRKAAAAFYNSGTTAKPQQERQFFEWSRTHKWVQRASAWDAEQRRQNELRRQENAEDARNRAVRMAQMAQRIGAKGMMQLDNLIEPEENPPLNALRYAREGIELEFLAYGLPISVVRQQVEEPDPAIEEHQQRMGRYGAVVQKFQMPMRERRTFRELEDLEADEPG